jgi:hypothetical protein
MDLFSFLIIYCCYLFVPCTLKKNDLQLSKIPTDRIGFKLLFLFPSSHCLIFHSLFLFYFFGYFLFHLWCITWARDAKKLLKHNTEESFLKIDTNYVICCVVRNFFSRKNQEHHSWNSTLFTSILRTPIVVWWMKIAIREKTQQRSIRMAAISKKKTEDIKIDYNGNKCSITIFFMFTVLIWRFINDINKKKYIYRRSTRHMSQFFRAFLLLVFVHITIYIQNVCIRNREKKNRCAL